jgi:hypothetical protein
VLVAVLTDVILATSLFVFAIISILVFLDVKTRTPFGGIARIGMYGWSCRGYDALVCVLDFLLSGPFEQVKIGIERWVLPKLFYSGGSGQLVYNQLDGSWGRDRFETDEDKRRNAGAIARNGQWPVMVSRVLALPQFDKALTTVTLVVVYLVLHAATVPQ